MFKLEPLIIYTGLTVSDSYLLIISWKLLLHYFQNKNKLTLNQPTIINEVPHSGCHKLYNSSSWILFWYLTYLDIASEMRPRPLESGLQYLVPRHYFDQLTPKLERQAAKFAVRPQNVAVSICCFDVYTRHLSC